MKCENKCVTFSNIDVIYPLPATHKESTKSLWFQIACDRFRFKRRIETIEQIITPILAHDIRVKTYRTIIEHVR